MFKVRSAIAYLACFVGFGCAPQDFVTTSDSSTGGDGGVSTPLTSDSSSSTSSGSGTTDGDAGSVSEPDAPEPDNANTADGEDAGEPDAGEVPELDTNKPPVAEQLESCQDECDDGIECTADRCDEDSGRCAFDTTACECTTHSDCERPSDAWACVAMVCDPRTLRCVQDEEDCECLDTEDCGDPGSCLSFACHEGECATEVTEDEPCNDGIECTIGDSCQSDGSCAGDASGCMSSGPPNEYACEADTYGDGTCHCGCGAVDIDCGGTSAAMCEQCAASGSCATACAEIARQNNALCKDIPDGWTCGPAAFADGVCDCGCGATDTDCTSEAATACSRCNRNGSCATACSEIDPENNSACDGPTWACPDSYYGDGVFCDCGCGITDSDCPTEDVFACDDCGTQGACSNECTDIKPDDNAVCRGVPASWTCSSELFGDGTECDCGCGGLDLDCRSNDPDECDTCGAEGSCAGDCDELHVDTSGVCELPSTWDCPEGFYGDGDCDCGCAALDIDCPSSDADVCLYSWCTEDINADDNTLCD